MAANPFNPYANTTHNVRITVLSVAQARCIPIPVWGDVEVPKLTFAGFAWRKATLVGSIQSTTAGVDRIESDHPLCLSPAYRVISSRNR